MLQELLQTSGGNKSSNSASVGTRASYSAAAPTSSFTPAAVSSPPVAASARVSTDWRAEREREERIAREEYERREAEERRREAEEEAVSACLPTILFFAACLTCQLHPRVLRLTVYSVVSKSVSNSNSLMTGENSPWTGLS